MAGRSLPRIVVAGIGNQLSGDDGAGLRVARTLRREPLPPYVSVHEAGMAGFRLIDLWMDADLCIVVDAMDAGEPPGTVKEMDGALAAQDGLFEAAGTLSAHGTRLQEALELGAALGPPYMPRKVTVFGIQMEPDQAAFGAGGLSPAVELACEVVATRIHEICRSFTAPC